MLNQTGFDLWADDYDKHVGLSDEENTYPFAGYKRLLGRVYEIVLQKERPAVLDLGFGTGVLTAKLWEAGCRVWGQDFSPRMIELAREKMPGAVLVQGDFSEGLAPVLRERSYDFILSTYALHHLDFAGKLRLIREALDRLNPGGELLIGDVAFPTQEAQEACRAAAGEEWDEEEQYFVFEELKAVFPEAEFEPVSFCAGIFRWKKPFPSELLGSCGFYCGACPTFLQGSCKGCREGQTEGDCFTRDCVRKKGLPFCGACGDFPCETILTKDRCTVLDKSWLRWKKPQSREKGDSPLELYIPRREDLWFYQKMLSDPATMAYNAPWFPPDGCLPFPESEWDAWLEKWIGREPERFYAYLRRRSDGAFVGGVNFHHTPARGWWDMGIVIYAPERGRGYGKQGLELLLDRAFRVAGISRLHNDFETTRDAAYRIHRAVGFRETGTEDGILQLELTREEYLNAL